MLPQSFLANDELVREFLETDTLEKSRTRQRAHIDAKKIKRYVKVLTEKGLEKIVTNRHVAEAFAHRDRGKFIFL
ncbi:MAG: hypothetical protein ACRC2S_07695 [Waterburya sp.]